MGAIGELFGRTSPYLVEGIYQHISQGRYAIFKPEVLEQLKAEGEDHNFFNEPFSQPVVQILEHVRRKANEKGSYSFKSLNELHNFIVLSSSFDISEEISDQMFLNKIEFFYPLSKIALKKLCRILEIELLFLRCDKKKTKLFKEFESRNFFGSPSKNQLILLFNPASKHIMSLNPLKFLQKECQFEVCLNNDLWTCRSRLIADQITHILPSHLRDVNPAIEFTSDETDLEINQLLCFNSTKKIGIKNGSFHIFFYEGPLKNIDPCKDPCKDPQLRKYDRSIVDWKTFSDHCDWIYTIRDEDTPPHIIYLNRRGNAFQLFHFQTSHYTPLLYKISSKRKHFSGGYITVPKKMKKLKSVSPCLCQNKIPLPFLQSPITSFELPFLLQSLGWDSESTSIKLNWISRLTVSFFDVEASTNYTPRRFPIIHGLQTSANVIHTGVIGVQNLCLIGYCDWISKRISQIIQSENITSTDLLKALKSSSNDSPRPKIFHIGGNQKSKKVFENTYFFRKKLVSQFLSYVHKKSVISQKIKKILFADILQALGRIEEIQNSFELGVYFNVYSKLTKAINNIINTFYIFGFNSSAYDTPMLVLNLYHLIGESLNPRQIRIFRKGNKIINLEIVIKGIRLIFKDYRLLESPGISLRTLCQRYNIKHEKGFFPHSINTSMKFLKSQKKMPSDLKSWVNVITGECETKENIKVACHDFKEGGFKDLYAYFVHYLKLDVICLAEIFLKYWNYWRFKEDFDFVLYRKFTISSLLYTLVFFKILPSDPYNIAPFKIKSDFYQELISQSKLGGITTCAGKGKIGKGSNFKINSHLKNSDVSQISPQFLSFYKMHQNNRVKEGYSLNSPLIAQKDQLLANHVLSYDISSLYASAMLHPLPRGPVLIWESHKGCPLEKKLAKHEIVFTSRNRTCLHNQEFIALRFFLRKEFPSLNGNDEIRQIRTQWSCGGQVRGNLKSLFMSSNLRGWMYSISKGSYVTVTTGCPPKKTKQTAEL